MDQSKDTPRAFSAIKIAVIMALLILVTYFASIVGGFTPFFQLSAKTNAIKDLKNDSEFANNLFSTHYDDLYEVANKIAFASTKEAVDDVLGEYIGCEQFGDLRYFAGNVEYDSNGLLVEDQENELILALVERNQPGCTDLYFDKMAENGTYCIAFYIPVKGSVYVDGLVSIVPARNIIDAAAVLNENADVTALITIDGKVLASATTEEFGAKYSVGNNVLSFVKNVTENQEDQNRVLHAITSDDTDSGNIMISGVEYTFATCGLPSSYGHLNLITFSQNSKLNEVEMAYVKQVLYVLVLAIVFLIISLIYTFIFHNRSKKVQEIATLTDATLECANLEGFRRVGLERMANAGEKKYLIYNLRIRQFSFIKSQLGDAKTNQVLNFVSQVIGNFCNENETFGYDGDDSFYVLYRYYNENTFKDRIQLINAIVNKNEILLENNITVKFFIGACPSFGPRRKTVKEMIECATVACDTASTNVHLSHVIYDEDVRAEIVKKEKIEAQMEDALLNGEFKLFLQPKYSVKLDKICGAEALVRWFDPKKGEYKFPGEFVTLFETNGFITKLDHFMFVEVCKYFQSAVERGETIYPISVNVSRVTAIQPDFINFYVGNKKKYGVGDKFITIEFTESFAMENYDTISDIVNQLHENGILCSIDDFGSGYSSFNILKNITMDELKLDRFFLTRGFDQSRDDQLLKTMIELAKSFGMTVVQEGVETKDIFNKVVDYGCDVVQGYYYAKAISLEEYKIFINTNTSIKYKSQVK